MSLISKDNLSLTLQSINRLLSKKADKTDIVQSNWNQNDENALDYIKSKPFYEYIDRNSIIVPMDTYEILSSRGYLIKGEFGVPILGETYTVRFGESIYEKVCYERNHYLTIGDAYAEFIISFYPNSEIFIETSNSGQKEIEIVGPSIVFKKIDAKYLSIESKMNKSNPIGTGSFSLNRKSNTSIGNYSFAEGYETTASGAYSHAEGEGTTASGGHSHAEGYNTKASGNYSHAEGYITKASDNSSHAEGYFTEASGYVSHAEGYETIASAHGSHAEGESTIASGTYSHAEGFHTTASEYGSHAEGSYTIASGIHSHAEGEFTAAYGNHSHAEGQGQIISMYLTGVANTTSYTVSNASSPVLKLGQIIFCNNTTAKIISYTSPTIIVDKTLSANKALTKASASVYTLVASGEGSHAEGYETIASGYASHAEGNITTASGTSAHAEGTETSAEAWCHAEGYKTTAAGQISHAEGHSTTATGQGAHAEGHYTVVSGDRGHAEGYYTIASRDQHVQGHYNTEHADASSTGTAGSAFIIGNGTTTARSNAFRITYAGAAYAKAAYNSTGADYAEFFEWEDGNFLNEDRRGYFVTLNNDKIKIATPEDDFILGVVSGQPAIIGNSDEEWTGRYILDEFGSFITEEFEYEEKTLNPETEEEIITIKTGIKYKENPEYDPTQTYIQRQDRAEWATVGMLGVLSVRDDGTCQANGYCTVAEDGTATMSLSGYRVIKRVNDNTIKIIFR